jgi:amino acid adenylation domain-containing protein
MATNLGQNINGGASLKLRPEPSDAMCIHRIFERQAAGSPDSLAVVHGARHLTYVELNLQANWLARRLRELGVRPDDRVAICAERSIDMVVGLVAILKSGAAYVPLDPTYPDERLLAMLTDSDPVALLTNTTIGMRLRSVNVPVELLDAGGFTASKQAADAGIELDSEPFGQDSNHLAYVIYTSGSTGRPKGVAMPHRAVSNLLSWQMEQPEEHGAATGRTLQFAALGFDVAFQEIFGTLCTGATLELVDEEIRLDPPRLFQYLCDRGIERLYLPYIALHTLAEAATSIADLSACKLRAVITAGEQLRITPQIRALFERLKNCRLHNHYGPTETHVVTSFMMGDDPARWPALPVIGRPINGVGIYVLDAEGKRVPEGEPGDLHISGECVARGYYGLPELTAERFLHDPFVSDVIARMYRTGDLGRIFADGTIEFLGRNDDQVKIRGYRVELGEVEARLLACSGVRNAAVIAVEQTKGETPRRPEFRRQLIATDALAGFATDRDYAELIERNVDLALNNEDIAMRHRPERFEGDVVFIRATLQEDEPATQSPQRWEPFVGGAIRGFDVESAHLDSMGPSASSAVGQIIASQLLAFTGTVFARDGVNQQRMKANNKAETMC